MKFPLLPFLCLTFCIPLKAPATSLDPLFSQSNYYTDNGSIPQTSGIAWAPDSSGRLFCIQQNGPVRIIQNGVLLPTPFATPSPLYNGGECGVIGIAFDPSFLTNHYVYLFVSVSNTEQQIIRYIDSNNVGTAKTVLVSKLPTQGINHNGGSVGIGHDGKLYWGVGDNGTPRIGIDADLTSLAAKVGRANRNGSIPYDNPYRDGSGPSNDYIWARGFRNPYTMTFQPTNGRLWLNVVGTLYEQIFLPTRGSTGGWDNYENNQPSGYLTPAITYLTNGSDVRSLTATGAVRNASVTTYTTTVAHGFRKGEKITVSGVGNVSFNGAFYVTGTPTTNQFTVTQTGSNATSGGGQAASPQFGGCVTGGTFWDSSAVPAVYRNNFFFGDFNSGLVMRARLDAGGAVNSVDTFLSGRLNTIDQAIGPDGALYTATIGSGTIVRTAYNAPVQALVITPLHPLFDEARRAVVNICLARTPTSNVTVTTRKVTGDTNITVFAGGTLTFTPANFSKPQTVILNAADDEDTTNDTAIISVSANGLTSESVVTTVIDNDQPAIVPSVPNIALSEGGTTSLTLKLAFKPAANVTVQVVRYSGDTSLTVKSGATLVFTPANYSTPQPVTFAAAEDADKTNDSATFTCTATGLPTLSLPATATDND